MRFYRVLGSLALPFIAACVPYEGDDAIEGFVPERNIPETVREVVAPGQDLSAIRINPLDGCYEYRYAGPVETTFLPLRSAKGARICTNRKSG